jgi:hypothetical protein
VRDRDRCSECGLDLAADPGGDHGEMHRLCWSCWAEQKPEQPFTHQDSAEWWVHEKGITDVIQVARFMRMDFGASVEGGDEASVMDEYRVLAEQALADSAEALVVRTLEEFAEEDEPAAAAVLGTDEAALIAEGGDVMVYGDGGAGKTTLAIDLGFHLATGRDWIGIPVPRAVRVLLIENEGPRPQLRRKLARKRAAWNGELGDCLRVYEQPWGRFSLADEPWREKIAQEIAASQIDVLIAGPVSRIGMEEAGTLQQVREFTELVADVRRRCGRPLTVILVHHENKAHAVSGAWEGSGDTLLHVRAAGNGRTTVFVQKARWSSEHSQTTMQLAWSDGEGFRPEGERDLLAELVQLLSDGKARTVSEIATGNGGIGANKDAVKELLAHHPESFQTCTGDAAKALGRSATAVLWKVARAPEQPEPAAGSPGGGGAGGSVAPLKGATSTEPPHLPGLELTQTPEPAAHDGAREEAP